MTLKRMDNVLIVVDELETVKAFFIEGKKMSGTNNRHGTGKSNANPGLHFVSLRPQALSESRGWNLPFHCSTICRQFAC